MTKVCATLLLGLLAASLPFSYLQWGTATNPTSYILMDGGPAQSLPKLIDNSAIVSVICTAYDAGSNPVLGAAFLLGSNDAVNWIQLGTAQSFPGNQTTVAWDPVTTGMQYVAVGVDGGGVAGTVGCTLVGKMLPIVN